MAAVIDVCLVGSALRFVVDEPSLASRISHEVACFPRGSEEPELTTVVRPATGDELDHTNRLDITLEGKRTRLRSCAGLDGWIDWETREAEVGLHQRFMPDPLKLYLRAVISFLALERGGVVLHSSAVVRSGAGWVFSGPSGSGKSTVARLSREAGMTVLGDDQNVIVPTASGYEVYGAPFFALGPWVGTSGSAPLGCMVLLEQDSSDHLEPLSRAAAVSGLLLQSPLVNAQAATLDRLLQNLAQIVGHVPAYKLHFTRGEAVWSVL